MQTIRKSLYELKDNIRELLAKFWRTTLVGITIAIMLLFSSGCNSIVGTLLNPYSHREAIAENPNTSTETLAKLLADDKEGDVSTAVAKNLNTFFEILAKLANDEEQNVRKAVAENPNTPNDILDQLADDEDWSVREAVAENPNTLEFIKKIRNPNTSTKTLANLSNT